MLYLCLSSLNNYCKQKNKNTMEKLQIRKVEKLQIRKEETQLWLDAIKLTEKRTMIRNTSIYVVPLEYATIIEIEETGALFLLNLGGALNELNK